MYVVTFPPIQPLILILNSYLVSKQPLERKIPHANNISQLSIEAHQMNSIVVVKLVMMLRKKKLLFHLIYGMRD